ncbi:MAG: hypothetical protein H6737_28000 [Alphaproteobacteria bacterium]|nr:hypothetical protein [Alphaproteobacteria bacterium]
MLLALALVACKSTPVDSDPVVDTDDGRIVPPVTASRTSVKGHAQECQQALGPIPGFDCLADTVPMPVTVHGEATHASPSPEDCDRPSLLEGSCNPWTRVGRKTGTWMNGDARPEVTFIFTCRSYDYEEPHEDGGLYHDVAMIGHNAETGATCFFQSFPGSRQRSFPSPLTAGDAPDYGTVDARQVWDRPQETAGIACHRCHGADPWVHSPWIDQLRDPADPTQPFVPATGFGNQTPYHVVGTAFSGWRLFQVAPEGNACLACHRMHPGFDAERFVEYSTGGDIGMPLTTDTTSWPGSHWMPPEAGGALDDWESEWRPHVDALLECVRTPQLEHCNLQQVPEGERYIDPDAPPRDTGFEIEPLGDTALECVPPKDGDVGTKGILATGTTCGGGHDFTRTCGEYGTNSEDRAFRFVAPDAGTWVFDTFGSAFDTTLSARWPCDYGDVEISCNDDTGSGTQSRLSLELFEGQEIVLVVDAYTGPECGEFVLSVSRP